MTKTTPTDIALKQASVKFTKAKGNVDGTVKAEKAYQKAKKQLAMARQAHTEQRGTHVTGGDANVQVKAVATRTGIKGE